MSCEEKKEFISTLEKLDNIKKRPAEKNLSVLPEYLTIQSQ